MQKILVVEDNEINAKLVKDFLKFSGYEILVISSGLDVLNTSLTFLPDLILMDIQIFGMSGIDAAKLLKSHETLKTIPIIAVSAFSKEQLDERNMSSYFIDFVEKPIDFSTFKKKIEKYIN